MIVKTVSVLICTYNRARLLRETLAALQMQEPPPGCEVEIVVVDNNSTDNTPAVVAESAAGGRYRIVALRESQQGKSFALNTGLAHARGEVLALTDDDVLPARHWLARIVEDFRARDVVFVFGKVAPRWGRKPPPELLTPAAHDVWGPLAIVDYGDAPKDYLPESHSQRLPVGANLAFSRAALVTIGGWRTDLGKVDNTLVSGEDHEIFLRLKRFGLYRGYYDPQASVRHFVPAARLTRAYFRRWFFWHGKTNALMLDDLYPGLDLARVPTIAGAPRFAFRQAAQQLWRYVRSRLRGDAVDALAQELYLIEYAGLFAQCWKQRRRRPDATSPRRPAILRASRKAVPLVALVGATVLSIAAASRVQLSIRDGRVWLKADRATIAEILAEWARVGQTQIANGDAVGGEPLTLDVAAMPEAAALDMVLRAAPGYVAVDRDATRSTTPTMSRYARIVIAAVSGAASGPVAASAAPTATDSATAAFLKPPVYATGAFADSISQPAPEPVEIAPGVRRLIGADGLPVPDDQEGAPSPPSSPPKQRGREGAHER